MIDWLVKKIGFEDFKEYKSYYCFADFIPFISQLIMWIFLILLYGCATTSQVISDIPKVQASNEIMKDCEEFIYPNDGSLKSFAKALYDNKKIYLICSNQNNAKKEFIKNNSKNY